MRYIVIALLALAAVWYFFLRAEPAPPPAPPPVALTPQQQFQALLAHQPVDAAKLAPLCSAYPQLAAQILRNKTFTINGIISDLRLAGMDERRAEILLRGTGSRQVVVSFDLDKYARTTVNERGAGKYAIVDTELLWIPGNGATTKEVRFTKETPFFAPVITKSVGATNVTFVAQGNSR
jgi:hypothetical protein